MNGSGRIEALALQQASGDGLFALLPEIAARIIGFDLGAVRGTMIPYAIPNRDVTAWRYRLSIVS